MNDKEIYKCPGCDIELVEISKEKVVFHCEYCSREFKICIICGNIRSIWDSENETVCCACAIRKKYFNSNIQDEEIINLTEEVKEV